MDRTVHHDEALKAATELEDSHIEYLKLRERWNDNMDDMDLLRQVCAAFERFVIFQERWLPFESTTQREPT